MQTLNFFAQQYVNVSDLMLLQSVPQGAIKDILVCLLDKGIVSGVAVTPTTPGSTGVLIAVGKLILEDGSDVTTTAATTLSLASQIAALTVGQSQWATIYAVPAQVNDTPVVTPAGATVNYRTYDALSFVVVLGTATTGTPAKSSTPPAGYTGVLVADVLLSNGLTNIVSGDIDQTRMLGFTNIPAMLATMAGLQSQITTIDGEITSIDALIATLNSEVATINGTLTTIAGEITTIDGTLATYSTHLSTLDGEITALQSRATTDEANITANTAAISVIQGVLADFVFNTSSGYFKIPFGSTNLIFQWATGTAVTALGYQTVNFPIAFPNACLTCQVSALSSGADTGEYGEFFFSLESRTPAWGSTSADVYFSRNSDHGGNPTAPIIWALGY